MILLLFFLLFAPYFSVLGYQIPVGYLVYFSCFVIYFLRRKEDFHLVFGDPLLRTIAFFSVVCAILFFINSLRRGDIDFKLLRLSIDPIIIYFASRYIFLAHSVLGKGYGFSRLIVALSTLNFINASAIYLCFISEGFNSLFYSVVQVNPKIFEYPVPRFSGFLYDGFSYASTLMSIITITCHVLYANANANANTNVKVKVNNSLLILLLHIFTIPASLLAGRTGAVILIVYFTFVFFFSARDFILLILKPRKFFFMSVIGIVVATIIVSVYGTDGPIGEYFRYSTRFITSYFDDSGYSEYTTSELAENHYFLPDDTLSLLIGAGFLSDWPLGSFRPDPAITLGIFAFGVIGLLVYCGTLLSPFVGIVDKRGAVNILLMQNLGMLIVFLVILAKDAYIFYPYPHFFLYFLCAFFIRNISFKAAN